MKRLAGLRAMLMNTTALTEMVFADRPYGLR